jgi:hypothetical protein
MKSGGNSKKINKNPIKTDEVYSDSTTNLSQFPNQPDNFHQQPKHENQLNPLSKQFATKSHSLPNQI